RVLVEGVAKKDATQLQGRAENNRVVLFPMSPLDSTNASLIGQLVDVRITESLDYSLRGELVANLDTIALAS
ncbi:MAG: TRAM domain-containing protein, partial [Burkholderiaceae bacterium]